MAQVISGLLKGLIMYNLVVSCLVFGNLERDYNINVIILVLLVKFSHSEIIFSHYRFLPFCSFFRRMAFESLKIIYFCEKIQHTNLAETNHLITGCIERWKLSEQKVYLLHLYPDERTKCISSTPFGPLVLYLGKNEMKSTLNLHYKKC